MFGVTIDIVFLTFALLLPLEVVPPPLQEISNHIQQIA